MLGSPYIFTPTLQFDKLSYWEKETYINHTDYLVIGSGIVGLSTAIHLKQRNPGKKVTVLERGYLPTGASTKNAGFACIGSPTELLADLSELSEKGVFETVEKRWKGLLYLKDLLGEDAIDYQSNGSWELFTPEDQVTFEACEAELKNLNVHLKAITGIAEVFKTDHSICAKAQFNGFNRAISHAAEGQINTGAMMKALVRLAVSLDVVILNGIEARAIENQHLITNLGSIAYKKLAVCTNGFAQTLLPGEDVLPARAQVIVTSPIKNLPFKGIFHFNEGYYYFRNVGDRVLLGGGRNLDIEGETTTEMVTTDRIVDHLNLILQEKILPHLEYRIEHQWAGTMGVGKSKAPIVKIVDENVYCGVRLGGMGVAIGTLVGKELADLMLDTQSG